MKSFKKMKKKSFRKSTFLEIEDGFGLPLISVSGKEKYKKINIDITPPIKERYFTEEEVNEYMQENPEANKKIIKKSKVLERDLTDPDYLAKLEASEFDFIIIDLCKHVNLKEKNENGEELWQDLELESDEDFKGLSKKLFSKEEDGGFGLGATKQLQ